MTKKPLSIDSVYPEWYSISYNFEKSVELCEKISSVRNSSVLPEKYLNQMEMMYIDSLHQLSQNALRFSEFLQQQQDKNA